MAAPEIFNFEISDENFDSLVLINSHKLPVFVLFLSPSSPTCIAMENSLISYAEEFAGQFILARLDVDMYTKVRDRLDVKNVPMLKIFKNGEMVHQELGHLSEEAVADVFRQFGIFNPAEELRLEAQEKHKNGQTPEAIQLLAKAAKMNPGNTKVAMDMCQIFLDMNMLAEGAELFTKLPNKVKETETGRFLIGQITFKKLALDTEGTQVLTAKLAESPNDEDTLFNLAICQIAEQSYQEGMNQLFALLKINPNAKGGGAQELAVVVINMLDLNNKDLSAEFRRQLSNIVAV